MLKTLDQIKQRMQYPALFSIGPGWYDLAIELDSQIALIEPDYQVIQVKEKFGGLRYYVGPTKNFKAVWDLILDAESRSFRICDTCGTDQNVSTGKNPGSNWIVTRCDDCRQP